MYDVTLRGVEVVDVRSRWHGQTIDLHITPMGINQGIGKGKIFDASGLKVSVGWVDMRAALMETLKDTPKHLAHSAAVGGFTHLGVFSNPEYELANPEAITNLMNTSYFGVGFLPLGAVSSQGDINELGLIFESGAKAFSAGHTPLQDARLITRALLYNKIFSVPICTLAMDTQIAPQGQIHEGMVSVAIGLPGIPELAEELAIQKLLSIAAYTDGRLHLNCVGTQKGFDLIQEAKNQGLNVTCDAAVYQFYFTDKDLADFNTGLKVFPPLRVDTEIVWRALRNGVLDAICSNHTPQDLESKRLEFDMASWGMLSLETFFGTLMTTKPSDIELSTLLGYFTRKPREILRMPQPVIEDMQIPDLTLFDDGLDWLVGEQDLQSKSKNSPFLNRYLKGKALGVFTSRGHYLSELMQSRCL